jgi:hypothetical protein
MTPLSLAPPFNQPDRQAAPSHVDVRFWSVEKITHIEPPTQYAAKTK